MKEKGFTLIELLAVIVILAIISLIATPIILGIINDSRKEGRKRSAEAIVHAAETGYVNARLKRTTSGKITASDIIENTYIENFKLKAGASITTKDGVKCTVEGNENINFEIICVDTKSNNSVILTKDIEINVPVIIYTNNSEDDILIGNSILGGERSAWCGIDVGENSCEDYNYGYNTEQDCLDDGYADCSEGTIQTDQMIYSDEIPLSENVYLKHVVVNNIITKSYVCSSHFPSACLRGGNSRYYGTYDGISSTSLDSLKGLNPTGNLAILDKFSKINNDNVKYNCRFSASSSSCLKTDFIGGLYGGIGGDAYSVYASDFNTAINCKVYSDGHSCCGQAGC